MESESDLRIPRRDARVKVAWRALCEKTLQMEQKLDPALAKVYERVQADPTGVGDRFEAIVRDISVNGAFLEGRALPILSRVAIVMEVPEWKRVEAVGWVLWRRSEACLVSRADGETATLQAGFGVVFEWVALETRLEIARRVAAQRGG
jgi:hypothetical protein